MQTDVPGYIYDGALEDYNERVTRIRNVADHNNLTRAELADAVGVSTAHMRNVLNGSGHSLILIDRLEVLFNLN